MRQQLKLVRASNYPSSPRKRGSQRTILDSRLRGNERKISWQAVSLPSKSVLALPDLGKNLRGRLACHADAGCQLRHIGAQKWICLFLLANGRRNGRLRFGDLLLGLSLACCKRFVVRLYRAREFNICASVFVSAVDLSVTRQIAQLHQRAPHLLRGSFDHATASNGEQCVSDEGELFLVKPISNMACCVAGRFDDIG